MRRLLVLASILAAAPAAAQNPRITFDTAGAFADAPAAELLRRARETRLSSDRALRSYTALVKTRMAVAVRTPLKDRTLVRQETAARVRWSRDAQTVVQLLAGRVQSPEGVRVPDGIEVDLFDPASDRMFFGVGSRRRVQQDSVASPAREEAAAWIEHPLGVRAEEHYHFASGDTLTLRLENGDEVRTIELRVTPRRDDPHTVRGLLWIDAATGTLVQAAFRLARAGGIAIGTGPGSITLAPADALPDDHTDRSGRVPGFLKPMEYDVSLVTVEYSLWDFKHWLPRTARFEGMVRMGALKVPASVEISYTIEAVETDADGRTALELETASRTAEAWTAEGFHRVEHPARDSAAEARGERVTIVLTPNDSSRMLTSPLLPPPVWDDAAGFLDGHSIDRMADRLRGLAVPFGRSEPAHVGWGFGEPDLVRYNRVEALSVGVRFSAPLPFAILSATARLGAGDRHPNGELLIRRPTARRTLELRAYHELATAGESRRALGFGNSISALLLGRDEGEYYRATGAALTWAPPADVRRSWNISMFIEDQTDVKRNTDVALPRIWSRRVFRGNIVADDALQYGGVLRIRPSWGTDPKALQFGIDFMAGAEAGDFRHARGRMALRASSPLAFGLLLGAEVAAGTSTGEVPVQRRFYLGGASTLRGYEPSTVSGTSMMRARIELARDAPVVRPSIFSDWGWAGDRDDIRGSDQRLSVGLGASLLDGLVRLDLARALKTPRGWRLELHLDAIM